MRVLIADDHPLYLEAAHSNVSRNFADADVVAVRNVAQAIERLSSDGAPFDLVILDYCMPGMDGVQGIRQITEAAPAVPIAIMSGNARQQDVAECLAAGAKGFLPKTMEPSMFAAALNMIVLGGSYMPVEFSSPHAPKPAPEENAKALSSREMDVLNMIVEGASNKEIARQLEIQEVTVKLHANRIFTKLGVKNRSQAAVKAIDDKLVHRE